MNLPQNDKVRKASGPGGGSVIWRGEEKKLITVLIGKAMRVSGPDYVTIIVAKVA